MLKTAVIGAQSLLGRELVECLEAKGCSVLPLAAGPMTRQEEEGDIVMFAPEPSLLEGLDVAILADTPQNPNMLDDFKGRVLDLRDGEIAQGEPLPLTGAWPKGAGRLKGRPALELVLAMLPSLIEGIADAEVSGVHLRSVAWLGDRGVQGLAAQSRAILGGKEPDDELLGYRAAFEVIPLAPKGSIMEVLVPAFHGDVLILHIKGGKGDVNRKDAPEGVEWLDSPPTSRDAAVTHKLLACYAPEVSGYSATHSATLTIAFDPILMGTLMPIVRLLGL
jgi:hypothetical protein